MVVELSMVCSLLLYPGICTAAAILMKERNREMCGLLQSLVSLLL